MASFIAPYSLRVLPQRAMRKYFGMLSQRTILGGGITFDAEPLEFGDAEDIVPGLPAGKEANLRPLDQLFRQQIERRQPDPATDDQLFLIRSSEVKPFAERPEHVEQVGVVQGREHGGPLPD